MFQKNEYIVHEHLGVCLIADIEKLTTDKKNYITYYVLKSLKDHKVAYLPTENHKAVLRPLMDVKEAEEVLRCGKKLSPLQKQEADFVLRHEENKEDKVRS